MDQDARRIINDLQMDFPLVRRPFAEAAGRLALDEAALIERINTLLRARLLTRFGPLFNAEGMGGGLTLAAIAVPPEAFERVTSLVNAFPEVAHNYARQHTFNMWFVVATETPEEIPEVLSRIEQQTEYPVFNLPKMAEYRLGFRVHLGPDGIDTVPIPQGPSVSPFVTHGGKKPDRIERAIVTATQEGLPLSPCPYDEVAEQVGTTPEEVLARMEAMIKRGWIRRIGVVPNHYRLGLRGNGMSVWELPDDQIEAQGLLVGSLGFVSHCYRRPQHFPHWPFNLFAMVHGQDRAAVENKVGRIERLLRPGLRNHALLHSTRILKKTGLRFRSGSSPP